MSNENCDMVFSINQILPNVINAINGQDFKGLKLKQGKIDELIDIDINNGLVLIFSESKLIDILYKKNMTKFLNRFKSIVNDNTYVLVIYDIEGVKNQEIVLTMVLNYLNLILDNCD